MSYWFRKDATLRKHADHDQSTHGNWARGGSTPNMETWNRALMEAKVALAAHETAAAASQPITPHEGKLDVQATSELTDMDKHIADFKADRPLTGEGTIKISTMVAGGSFVPYSQTPFFDKLNALQGTPDPKAMDPNDYQAARGKLFGAAPVEDVPLKGMIFTQEGIFRARAEEIRDDPKKGGKFPVQVVRYKGRNYLMNGHHRIAAEALKGLKTTRATVVIID